ncbi:MAG TPA: efflux RND transporter permease subunit, partial [Devosia sp.]|nr:efflux RND transporter permease subunit [Devosia sp.]
MIRWFAGHKTASNLLLIVMLAIGIFAAPTLLRETFPDYSPTEASINIAYRGASAADVEDAICSRISDAVKGVANLEELSCTAQDNVASAVAKMSPGGDVGRFMNEVDAEIGAITDFPAGADTPVITRLYTTDLVAAIAVYGDMSFVDLEAYANDLELRLFDIDNVAEVVVKGLSQRQWQIEISSDVLRQYGLSVGDISALIRQQNIDMPLGTLSSSDAEVQLRFVNQSRSIEDLENLVVLSGPSGGELRLGQIANIEEGYELEEEKIFYNGERALILEVRKNKDSDAINVMAGITDFLENERAMVGSGVTLAITQDMTSIVADRLAMLVSNGIIGLVLVAGTMSLFYRPRLAIWAILGLPVAFAGSFAVMALLGLSLNMITLVGLLVAIGIVMDDSVVITDSIYDHAAKGYKPIEAVVYGVKQVLPGVMSSFLTTVAVFGPLSFLSGELGTVLEVMPIVLLAALAASLVEAFLILPHHLKGPIAHAVANEPVRFSRWFDAGFEKFREGSGRVADGAIKIRYFVMGGLIIVLLGSVGFFAGGNIKMEAMPDMEGDVIEARLLMPQGTPLNVTQDAVGQVVDALARINAQLAQPEGKELVQAVQVRYNENVSAGETGSHVATVGVDLLTAEMRATGLDELVPLWQEEIGDIYGLINLAIQEPGFGPAGIPIEIRIQGRDLDQMKRASRDLTDYLEGYVGVFNVMDDLRPGKPQRQYSLSEGANNLGFTSEAIAAQIRSGMLGDIVDDIQLGNQNVEVLVSQTQGERSDLDALDRALVTSKTGQSVPLNVVSNYVETRDWGKITLVDGVRTITVQADVDAGKANASA